MSRGGGEPSTGDASLIGARFTPRSHRGLTYPLGDHAPEPGELHKIAPGLHWARLPMFAPLNHVNVWVLDDGAGVTLVDTGIDTAATRALWDQLLEGPLGGRPATRVIGTHFHPDHIGLAGWLAGRFDVRLWMTRTEFLMARMLTSDVRDAPPAEAINQMRGAGWAEELIDAERAKGWGRFAKAVSPLPLGHVRVSDGDELRIGKATWTAKVGSGHSPEHLCLIDLDRKLMIAGDQVLPRITSNVSMSLTEPDGDPLGEWLASIERFRRDLPDDLLVLPSHGLPFHGLHARLAALQAGHEAQLDALAERLRAGEARAVDVFGVLFARKIEGGVYGLATGEALAHLRRLEITKRAVREDRDGVWWFRAA